MSFDPERVRAKIVARLPFLGEFITPLQNIEDRTVKTLKTDGLCVRYNPEFMDGRSGNDQFVTYLHEVIHNFLGHPLRYKILAQREGEDCDYEAIQRAGDYAVNDMIDDCGFSLPKDALYDYRYLGMAFEEIYRLIAHKQPPKNSWQSSKHGELEKQGDPNKDPHAQPDPGDEDSECGQMSEQEIQQALQQQQSKQVEALTTGQLAGSLPKGLRRYFEELTESKVDWRELLPMTIEQVLGFDDYSLMNPDPRYSDDEFFYPGMIGQEHSEIVVGFDTSGSITDNQAKEQCSEVVEVLKNYRPEKTHVLWCDTRVKGPQTFTKYDMDDPELKPVGGGCTKFTPVFNYVEDNGISPKLLIYMTDGYCNDFPRVDPGYPIIWLVKQGHKSFKPPFGEVIHVD